MKMYIFFCIFFSQYISTWIKYSQKTKTIKVENILMNY